VPLFGHDREKVSLRVVPRAPGDLTPLDPPIAEALRKAGLDPEKFTAAPTDPAAATADVLAGVGTPGTHVTHTFRFAQLADALRAIEQLVDPSTSAHISKTAEGWLVAFDAPADAAADEATAHARFATVASALGGEDRGAARKTVNVNVKRIVK